jgi:hypothetical protein
MKKFRWPSLLLIVIAAICMQNLLTAARVEAADPTTGSVRDLPKIDGKTTGVGPHSRQGLLLGNPPLEASGVYDSLVGAVNIGMAPVQSADSTVDIEISVDSGRVRVYAEAQDRKNYLYADAIPSRAAHLTGRLIYGMTSFQLVLQSVDGTATGIHYHIKRADPS